MLRIALLIDHAPAKLGSLEDWLCAFAEEAASRGHRLDLWSHRPVHEQVERRLADAGSVWFDVGQALMRPRVMRAKLASSYGVVHLNLFSPRSRATRVAWAAWPCRLVYVDHLSDMLGRRDKAPLIKRVVNRLIMARMGAVVAVSNYLRGRAPARFGVPLERVRTIYNGVNLCRFPPRAATRVQKQGLRIVAVAHLIKDKGIDILVRAIAADRCRPWLLDIVGEGPELPTLQALVAQMHLTPRVRFLGRRSDVPECLAIADVFVHPAIWGEAFGLTVTEGMAAGCAVVASSVGAIPEIVEDGRSGLLVAPGNVEELTVALARLWDDPALRADLGFGARQRVEQRFSLEQTVAAHLDVCAEVGQ